MAAKSPLSELREMNVRRQRETQNPESDAGAIDAASNLAPQQPSNLATKQDSDLSSNIATQQPLEVKVAPLPTQVTAIPPFTPRLGAPGYASALETIPTLRKTSLEQLNIRIPAGFNEWLAEEAHRRRREGITKQSLVTDALEAMIRLKMESPDAGN